MAENKSARKTLCEYCECEPRFAFILAQWHPTKNSTITPDDVSPSSRTKAGGCAKTVTNGRHRLPPAGTAAVARFA